MRSLERRAVADRHHDILQAMPLALVVVHVVRSHVAQPVRPCEIDEPAAALGVAVRKVLLQLDVEILAPEP